MKVYGDDIVHDDGHSLLLIIPTLVLYVSRSTKGTKRLTPTERRLLTLSGDTLDAFIGIMLGDGCLSRRSPASNARFLFTQSGKLAKREYFDLVFSLFSLFLTPAMISKGTEVISFAGKSAGIAYTQVTFTTMALPCFTYFYTLFHVNGVKVVPQCIIELLTPCGLAH